MRVARTVAVSAGALLVAALVLASTPLASVGAAQVGQQPSFVVSVQPDGSAEMAATVTFDLGTATGTVAYQTIRDNRTVRQNLLASFRRRMHSAAANATNATGREMTVEDTTIDLRTTSGGSVGVIILSATWSGLAAVRDGKLVVNEPFGTAYEPERTFVVNWPDGYGIERVTPAPDESGDTSATWYRDRDLTGFELVLSKSAAGRGDGSLPGVGLPGLDTVTALGALLAALIWIAFRRRAPFE